MHTITIYLLKLCFGLASFFAIMWAACLIAEYRLSTFIEKENGESMKAVTSLTASFAVIFKWITVLLTILSILFAIAAR